jgi:DNA-binding MarR family transcriptional regulator
MAKTRRLNAAEVDTWRTYRRMRALLDLQLARDLAADGLSKADYDVLSTLSEVPGGELRLSDLAAWMLWSRTRLSHHVARMQGRGLVDRVETPEDGRGTVVVLAPEGRRVLEEAAPAHVDAVRAHFIDLMTPEQVRVLGEVAHAVVDNLSDGISLNRRSAPGARQRSAR